MRVMTIDSASDAANGNGSRVAPKKVHRDPICQDVAEDLFISPKTAEHWLRELPREVVAFLRAFNRHGAGARKERFMREIRAADAEREAPPLVPATWQRAQEADAKEDAAETAYLSDHSDANLERLIRCAEEEIRQEESRLLGLYAERDQRRRMA